MEKAFNIKDSLSVALESWDFQVQGDKLTSISFRTQESFGLETAQSIFAVLNDHISDEYNLNMNPTTGQVRVRVA